MNICKVEGCTKKASTKKTSSFCYMHKNRWRLFKSYDKPPKKPLPTGILHICKKHGELDISKVRKHIYKNPNTSHLRPVYYSCKICHAEGNKEKYKKDPYKQRHLSLIKHKQNRDNNVKRMRIYRQSNLDKEKETKIKKKYGITINQYHEMLKNQNNLCLICNKKELHFKNLVIDHCHKTNKLRGLLCNPCNLGLGSFKDSIENLKRAIKYLKSFII